LILEKDLNRKERNRRLGEEEEAVLIRVLYQDDGIDGVERDYSNLSCKIHVNTQRVMYILFFLLNTESEVIADCM